MEIGPQLLQRREALGLSRAEVARTAKVTKFGLLKIELAGSNPKYQTLVRIGEALGWTLGWSEKNGDEHA